MTELVFIIDRSGSMAGLEEDTIGGFNSMLEKQKKIVGDTLVSTITFSSYSEVVHDRIPLNEVNGLKEDEYSVGGTTAILDAIGSAINHIAIIHKYARKEDVPEKTIFVITTDGIENTSSQYSYQDVKALIEKQQNEFGWEFLFLGANIDAISEGERFGIRSSRSVRYHSDKVGTRLNYEVLDDAISEMRRYKQLSECWKDKIDEDFENRDKSPNK